VNQPDYKNLETETIQLAEKWQEEANRLLSPKEKSFQKRIKKLLTHKTDKFFLNRMIDRCFRTTNNHRIADQVSRLMMRYGVPSFFSIPERLMAYGFLCAGRYLPFFTVPVMIKRIMKESSDVILPEEEEALHQHLDKRRTEGVRMNLNHLGEAILGEEQARAHLTTYLADLANPEIENISVKISTIYSQILPIAFDTAVAVISRRLERLYSEAQNNTFVRADGTKAHKFVNLDMEAFQDLEITAKAFMTALDQKDLVQCFAGIALQAYLPDSVNVQKMITEWAKKRVKDGGSPVRIRLVKGANLEMEKVEASIRNWPLAPFNTKADVDACFKRMVEYGLRPENAEAVNIGIASHNLFDLAWASLLAEKRNVTLWFGFEMLEGMADHMRRAIMKDGKDMLLYAPVTHEDQFTSAIAYLVRRLDENTGDENFLRYICDLKPGSSDWGYLKRQFKESLKMTDINRNITNRFQDRNRGDGNLQGAFHEGLFINEPDTDWSLSVNREWADGIREKWQKTMGDDSEKIPAVVSGNEIFDKRKTSHCADRGSDKVIHVAEFALADKDDIQAAVKTAAKDPDGWRKKNVEQRHEVLSRVADELRKARGDLIGAAASGTGKIFTEADVEVSEAIDFVEYYPLSVRTIDSIHNLRHTGKGVGLVITPWNFPIAIPCGGIAAALAAGNTVIFKPASAAVLPAWHLCQCFWKAGVSKNVLQFLPCQGDQAGALLAGHPDVDFIIFTGGTETAVSMREKSPDTYFAGETGGKNATIVTAIADRDQAVKNIIHSAFSNSGQKCSATSLLILEKEVYEDTDFKNQLIDASKSLKTGTPWAFESRVGPLIHPPEGDLKNAIETLAQDEEWALKPEKTDNNSCLWSPGIKWAVNPGSYSHMTEFFGPVLSVMCAKNLNHAVELVNQTGYGLTSGIESLDEREQEYWIETIQAGNLYINRGTTGAVVLRQPFGGMGRSAVGCGIKAGGPNYVLQFMNFRDIGFPITGAVDKKTPLLELMDEWFISVKNNGFDHDDIEMLKIIAAVKNYHYAFDTHFFKTKDYFHLRGQDNLLRYRPTGKIIIRLHENDSLFEILGRIAASKVSGCECCVSIPSGLANAAVSFLENIDGKNFLGDSEMIHQTDQDLIGMLDTKVRIRYASGDRISDEVLNAAASGGFYLSSTPVLMEGRIELLQYLREQSICHDYHRYGNLGERAVE